MLDLKALNTFVCLQNVLMECFWSLMASLYRFFASIEMQDVLGYLSFYNFSDNQRFLCFSMGDSCYQFVTLPFSFAQSVHYYPCSSSYLGIICLRGILVIGFLDNLLREQTFFTFIPISLQTLEAPQLEVFGPSFG